MNRHLALISGASTTGKSACFRHIEDPEGVLFLNCESGKELPFREGRKFKNHIITDPYQVYEGFEWAESKDDIHTVIVDSVTFLMDMFESVYVVGSTNTMQG